VEGVVAQAAADKSMKAARRGFRFGWKKPALILFSYHEQVISTSYESP
jgi:hypothetical protein